jgi:4-alpha-glucanotransferase
MGVIDWIDLAQDRYKWWDLVHEVMEHAGSIKFGEFLYF